MVIASADPAEYQQWQVRLQRYMRQQSLQAAAAAEAAYSHNAVGIPISHNNDPFDNFKMMGYSE